MSRRLHSLALTGLFIAILPTALPALGAGAAGSPPGMNAETFSGLEWRGIGPALMSGRIADIAVDPDRRSTWYVAARAS